MKINKYVEMHIEKYLFEIIKEYIKNKMYKKYVNGVKYNFFFFLRFRCFDFYLETYGLH